MSVFADSSALVKLYADEPGAEQVRAITSPLAVSIIARVEVPAALWRKHRSGQLSIASVTKLTTRFTADFHGTATRPARFTAMTVSMPVLDHASALVARHGLRAYDAIQLASAIAARHADDTCDTFACFDKDLATAAQTEGFTLTPHT